MIPITTIRFLTLIIVVITVTGVATAAGTTTVSVETDDGSINIGQTTTAQVLVANADGGVGAAEFRVTVDPEIAAVTNATVLASGSEKVTIAEDGSWADIEYAFRDTDDTGSVQVVTVTIEARDEGETDISLGAAEGNEYLVVYDESGTGYDLNEMNSASLTVVESADDVEESSMGGGGGGGGGTSPIDPTPTEETPIPTETPMGTPNETPTSSTNTGPSVTPSTAEPTSDTGPSVTPSTAEPTNEPTTSSTPSEGIDPVGQPGLGIILTLLAILSAAWLYHRR